jgi:group II intron reverse transcriptase/maturase
MDPHEGREEQLNETVKGNKFSASTEVSLSTKLNRLSEIARNHPKFCFKTLSHLLNPTLLKESFYALRRKAAPGVDGITAGEYEEKLDGNLKRLHQSLLENKYRAQPLRRTYIEKDDGKLRPLSIPALEDKIVQKAVVEIMSRIYEVDFLSCSYGYRPNIGAHNAVGDLQRKLVFGKVNYVFEADITNYFGTIVREKLMEMLRRRISDKVILKLIGKWLKAGVIDKGLLLRDEHGTYQGSIISPVLANIYLHEVLDVWMSTVVKPRLYGEAYLLRYADDFVICLQYRNDAHRLEEVLPKRLDRFGLKLHPDKTKLIEFGRFASERREGRKPDTFVFLGFTFYCSTTKTGKFTIKLKTASKSLRKSLSRVKEWCKENRHLSLELQSKKLSQILTGHYQYFGRISNIPSLRKFYRGVLNCWYKWLSRRGSGYVTWEKFLELQSTYPLPKPHITEQWSIAGTQ